MHIMTNITKFILCFAFTTLAFGQVSVKKEGSELMLNGSDCSMLMKQANAINIWRTADAKTKPLSSDVCKCATPGECKVNITKVIPKIVLEKESSVLVKNGPNSWNSSLVTAGILPHHRYTQKSEMSFWMNSPLCKERAADEAAAPGDIIAIRNFNGEEVHGFVNLTKELSYSKNGFRKGTKYQLANPAEIYETYGVSAGCEKVFRKPADTNACPFYANVFKCDSMDEYLAKNPMHDKDLKETWKTLDAMDCQLSKMTFNDTFTQDQAIIIKTSVESISILAESQINSTKVSPEDKFMWKAIKFKAISLTEQVGML
jgi:hypothetical protein